MSNIPDTRPDPPLVEQHMTNLSIAFDVVRSLTHSRFEELFEPARERLQAREPAEDHSDVPMLAVPINLDTESKRITEVGEAVEYWSTPDGSHITLNKNLYSEHTDKNEVVFYLDCRNHAETLHHFRVFLLFNLENRKRNIKEQIESGQESNKEKHQTNQDKRVNACDICEIEPEGETGFVGVSTHPRNSDELSGLNFLFCADCGDEILELLSSFEPIDQPTSSTPYAEIFMQQSECGFCSDPMKDGSTRAGIDFLGPVTEQPNSSSDRAEELYAICPDCYSVFRTFLQNIGLTENEK